MSGHLRLAGEACVWDTGRLGGRSYTPSVDINEQGDGIRGIRSAGERAGGFELLAPPTRLGVHSREHMGENLVNGRYACIGKHEGTLVQKGQVYQTI